SPAPRALETAVAMGFAVNDQLEALGDLSPAVLAEVGHHERWAWQGALVAFAHPCRPGRPTAPVGQRQRGALAPAPRVSPTHRRACLDHLPRQDHRVRAGDLYP